MELSSSTAILVVDDNPNQLIALRVILAELGAQVMCVGSGREALRRLLHQDFAAILLDVNMPTMDGFETAYLIRQRARSEHTPIIFITAFADETHVARCYSLGAVDYINTPVVPEVLRAKVTVFIELFRKSAEVRRQTDSLRRRTEQLRGLTAASLAIHEASSIERMLAIVAERARAILGAGFGAARIRPDRGGAQQAEARAVGCRADTGAVLDDAAARTVAASTPVRIDWSAYGGECGAGLAVALAGRDGRVLGVLVVGGKSEGEFTDDDGGVLQQLGQMASIAAENTGYREEQEVNRLKDEFLATVSHELRTPLTAMLSWVRLLQDDALGPAERVRALEVIDRNARAQSRLVDDLLDTSRIVTGKLQIAREPLELEQVVVETVESVRPAAASKGIDIGIVLEAKATVTGDARRLQQVLWNVLSNAIKFTPHSGRVDVVLRRDNAHAEVRVTDTGPGISSTFLPHVFDRFRQADTSTTRAHGGLGLGLAIVRHLVELHGGVVLAESAGEQRGATFAVRLPLAAPAVQVHGTASPTKSHGSALEDLRILVVEDDGDSREAITKLLTSAGARVVAVASVRAAISAIVDEMPDVVVSDIGLPDEDGYVLIRRIRELRGAGGAVPVLALTAYTHPEDRARALSAGFQAHVAKPIDPGDLFAAVETCVSARRAKVASTPPPTSATM